MQSRGNLETASRNHDSERFLFLTLGTPGSGKSEFVQPLAKEIGAAIFNSDRFRAAIFQHDEKKIKASYTPDGNAMVFGAMDEAIQQTLEVTSVILDANNNRYKQRKEKAAFAHAAGAQVVVICMETPLEESVRRAGSRVQKGHHVPVDETVVRRMAASIEPPRKDERAVFIGGTIPFEEQYEQFTRQLG